MKITRIKIHANFRSNGLPEVELDRLGDLVILTGRNGSGKSRILRSVMDMAANVMNAEQYSNAIRTRDSHLNERRRESELLQRLRDEKTGDSRNQVPISQNERSIKIRDDHLTEIAKSTSIYESISTDPVERTQSITCVEFLPKASGSCQL